MSKTTIPVIKEKPLPTFDTYVDRESWDTILQSHQAFFASNADVSALRGLRDEIVDSWLRSYQMKVDPDKKWLCVEIGEEKYHEQLCRYEALIKVAEAFMRMVENLDFSEDYVFELVGRNGISLLQKGNLRLHEFVAEKSVFNEATMGTNAHSLCMRHKRPFLVIGPEHYCKSLHGLSASAVPIMDEQDNVLASLLFTSVLPESPWSRHYHKLLSHAVGLAASIVSAIENKLRFTQCHAQIQKLEHTVKELKEPQSRAISTKKSEHGDIAAVTFEDILGPSEAINNTISLAKRFASTGENILLTGESGTGKEYFAQAIHNHSCLSGPFMSINCAAIPPKLIESELFGYEGGSFTGAERGGKPGKIELADNGTLFLDEIGDMPLELQATLLRVLENKRVIRLGGSSYKQVHFRVLAATNRQLSTLVQQGNFREDLFYRLSILTIELQPLRNRKDDLRFFIEYSLEKCRMKDPNEPRTLSPEVYTALLDYSWPGNVRQLKNILYSAYHSAQGDVITLEDLPVHLMMDFSLEKREPALHRGLLPEELLSRIDNDFENDLENCLTVSPNTGPELSLQNLEKAAMRLALLRTDNNVAKASELLDISKATLYRKMREYDLTG